MTSIMTKKHVDRPPRSYPYIMQCRTDSDLLVMFTGNNEGMIIHKGKFDDRPLFRSNSDWNMELFDLYDDAIILQND